MNFFASIVIFFSFFPYLKTSPLQSDIQPHVIMLYALFCLLESLRLIYRQRVTKSTTVFVFIGFLISTLLIFLQANIVDSFRILFFLCMLSVIVCIYKRYPLYISSTIQLSVLIYFVGIAIQFMFGDNSLAFLVSNLRTSHLRGFTSFASEPSFLGLVSISQIILLEFFKNKYTRLFQMLAFFNLVMSASLFAIGPMIAIMFFYLLYKNKNFITLLSFIIAGGGILFVLISLFPETRAVILINKLLVDPMELLHDVSLQNRLLRSFSPLYLSFLDNFQLHTFDHIETKLQSIFSYLDLPNDMLKITRLSNVATYFIYPFGLIGVLIIFIYFYFIIFVKKTPIFLAFSIVFFLLSNITILTPYAILIFALPFAQLHLKGNFDTIQDQPKVV